MPGETELTTPVKLTKEDGSFNRAAHGWARQPIVDTAAIDGSVLNGKNRRWEYWCVLTPTHILAFSIADIDYFAPASVWIFDRKQNKAVVNYASVGPIGSVKLSPNVEDGPHSARHSNPDGELAVDIEHLPNGTRIRASVPGGSFDVIASMPPSHERTAVVVPWSDDLFQYTLKDISRPATGSVTIGGETFPVPEGSWAMLDHGRGRWPSKVHWNWGAGSGRLADGRVMGLQVGDKWTDGTGSTENSFLLGTRVYKISDKLTWKYDVDNWMDTWHISGGGLDATLTPFYNKASSVDTEQVKSRTDQCFGVWKGRFDTGEEMVEFEDIVGFAEDVTKTW
ncbi:glycoside hydrolase family 2 sugar binding protein [Cutaneotrichosporon oleaginosum]|uniref:Glycoside hydrolase family 2 sugar binding protein n=1 Tax=Cutaneotrichosporon oleaginosum TaxID=879819 RepID=A0A0J0XJP1_9TREE|nr:glycoside hydrolase family 2 sugar binding protein [Cutaneotrichosporon oleaginosum]KLT41308.1 glycoside hydrolase family 2 sugar binding protein [Cutaneotrichosporon oleaginosum]TXT14058.1 hypothetical protein COLE_00251 [Cutaneotrichosporon oleaginosum]